MSINEVAQISYPFIIQYGGFALQSYDYFLDCAIG